MKIKEILNKIHDTYLLLLIHRPLCYILNLNNYRIKICFLSLHDTSRLYPQKLFYIIRREFIKGYFPSVYTNNYSNDPSEMDAERYGIRYTLAYFESDPIITKTEAEEILYQFAMSEDSIHSDIIDSYRDKLHNIYDILDLFDRRATGLNEDSSI